MLALVPCRLHGKQVAPLCCAPDRTSNYFIHLKIVKKTAGDEKQMVTFITYDLVSLCCAIGTALIDN